MRVWIVQFEEQNKPVVLQISRMNFSVQTYHTILGWIWIGIPAAPVVEPKFGHTWKRPYMIHSSTGWIGLIRQKHNIFTRGWNWEYLQKKKSNKMKLLFSVPITLHHFHLSEWDIHPVSSWSIGMMGNRDQHRLEIEAPYIVGLNFSSSLC